MTKEEYYKSLKVGDRVKYYSRVPYDFEYTSEGIIESISDWDESHDLKMGVTIATLNESGKPKVSVSCSVYYIHFEG